MKLELLKQKLDYDKIVTGADLDLDTYHRKFKMWDYVVEHGLLEKEDMRAINLLHDETIYAYAFFKNDEGDPMRYTAYQDVISGCTYDFKDPMDPNRFLLYKSSNQIGKSRKLICGAIKKINTEDNINIIMVSKSLPQSQFLLATIRHVLNNSAFAETWREDIGETANTTVLTFERNKGKIVNRLICAPSGEGLLGYPVHYLYLDELDFYEDGKTFFWKVAFPRVVKTKGQIIGFSNPDPEIARASSLLWELWHGDLFERKFSFNFLDAPWNTQAEYDRAKKNSPSHIFVSTHDGNFPEEGGAFFSFKEISQMLQKDWNNTLPNLGKPAYISLDLGKMNDNSVLCVGFTSKPKDRDDDYLDLDVRYIEIFPLRTNYDKIAERLREVQEYYEERNGVAASGYDSTGQKTFEDLLSSMGISAEGVDFSKKESNKNQLYNDFKLLAENQKIRIVHTPEAYKQLSNLVFKYTESKILKSKHTKVENLTKGIHDDIPDSLAILIHIAVCPSSNEVSMEFI